MIGNVIFNLIIGPLEMLFEIVFSLMHRLIDNPLLILIAMSIVVNLFALPLYKRADAIQEEENEKQAKMAHWVEHIKKTFKGDERYMMMQEYYRIEGYSSLSPLRGSVSLILQIPFFIAAYHYLSNLAILKEMSFWIFTNLGEPDQLIKIGDFSINVMPILMTLINVCSAYIYLKGASKSQKIQTYALALIFLVLLYTSPSGLVIYWTCNQVFSLLKNIFMKLVKNNIILGICVSCVGIAVFLAVWLSGLLFSGKRIFLLTLILICCQIPLILALRKRNGNKVEKTPKKISAKVFLFFGVFLTIFIGVVVPLSVISSSPTEFVSYSNTPAKIIVSNASMVAGVFLVWFSVYYFLFKTKMRNIFTYFIAAFSGIAIVDYLLFGTNLGFISEYMVYDTTPVFQTSEILLNLLAAAGAALLLCILLKLLKDKMIIVCLVLIMGTIGLMITHISTTSELLKEADIQMPIPVEDAEPAFQLSRTGKNVVMIMLDRAASIYMPYILNEKPELMETYAGFTYYKNTLAYGAVTYQAGPALYGGYDYVVGKINARNEETLNEKHTEAMQVLPSILSENGFLVQLADPPYLGRYYRPYDYSYYDQYENVYAFELQGKVLSKDSQKLYKAVKKVQDRSVFFYSMMKVLPLIAQDAVYDEGVYYSTESSQYTTDVFVYNYSELDALPQFTEITEEYELTYFQLENDTAHSPAILDPVTYEPAAVPNSEIYGDTSRFTVDGITMNVQTYDQVGHYNSLMAALLKIGEWLDYLREEGVYDNTRIIIVADHGNGSSNFPQYLMPSETLNIQRYIPLMLVKDFDSTEFTISDEFMTNADVIALTLQDLVEDPVNPFTGNPINMDYKYEGKQLIVESSTYTKADISVNTVITANDKPWAYVTPGNLYDTDNWEEVPYEDIDFSAYKE